MNLPYECGRIIAMALVADVAIDAGNVVDLLADNLPGFTLARLREALALSNYAGRWPGAEVAHDATYADHVAKVEAANDW